MRLPIAFLTCLLALPAFAQNGDDLARLRKELDEARATIIALEAQRETLMEQLTQTLSELAALRAAAGETPEPTIDVPLDPFACPDSMLAEVQRRYEREIAPLPTDSPVAERKRREALDRWLKTINRELRARVRWRVAFDDLRPSEEGDDFEGVMTIIDPVTHQPVGRKVRARVPGRFAARVLYEDRFKQWEVAGLFIAALRQNPERLERGVFDAPLFVGPEVEFGYTLDWEGLAGFDPEKPVKPGTTGPAKPEKPVAPGDPGTAPR